MNQFDYDVIVIGGGPGGYNCAIRSAQLGFKTLCVEKNKLGGTCLNVGCIPSKALLESSGKYYTTKKGWLEEFGVSLPLDQVHFDLSKVMSQKDAIVKSLCDGVALLLKANGADHINGFGSFIDKNTIEVQTDKEKKKITSKYFIIATGSYPICIKDHNFDEEIIISSDSGINLQEVPKTMVIIGAGVIGLELGSVWSRFGTKVTVLEYLDKVAPTMDEDVSKEMQKLLTKQGLEFKLGVGVNKIEKINEKALVHYTNRSDQATGTIEADKVLVSIGRGPNTKNLGLDKIGIETDKRGFIINNKLQTNISNIFVIGDVTTGPMLAHKAEEEGVLVVEYLSRLEETIKSGKKIYIFPPELHHDIIPAVIYTHPEAASIGKTEQELKESGIEYNVAKVSFNVNGRAKCIRETDGFVKLLCDKKNNYILGVHIVHAFAGSMINELSAYMMYKASPDDICLTTHTHPDLNEVIKAAAMSILDKPLASAPKSKKI